MTREEFEALRDMAGKEISIKEIVLEPESKGSMVYSASGVILADSQRTLKLQIRWNAKHRSTVLNVSEGKGKKWRPICRLCVGKPHLNDETPHKHAMTDDEDRNNNLREDVKLRPELSGFELQECFDEFCRIAKIESTTRVRIQESK